MSSLAWPVSIIWPGDTPETGLPQTWEQLDDGRIKAVYQGAEELRRSIEAIAGARAEPPIETRVHRLEDLADYMQQEELQAAGPIEWRPHPEQPKQVVWMPVKPKS